MPQFAVFIHPPRSSEVAPTRAERDAHGAYADELIADGVMVAAFALKPAGAAGPASDPRSDMTDGPFAESKELIAGFYVIEAEDLDSAIAIARRNPINQQGGGVEVRQVESGFIADPKLSR